MPTAVVGDEHTVVTRGESKLLPVRKAGAVDIMNGNGIYARVSQRGGDIWAQVGKA